MFDQIKHVIARPMTDKMPLEQRFNSTPSTPFKVGTTDPATAFERSGWVYI
uniref:Uncharacterized protein n=1 Tax=Peronospora matthiolae TaxID=2874970 RepID=A0AAV1UCT4_9STRA